MTHLEIQCFKDFTSMSLRCKKEIVQIFVHILDEKTLEVISVDVKKCRNHFCVAIHLFFFKNLQLKSFKLFWIFQ